MATAVGISTWTQVETYKKCQNRERNKELDRKATFFIADIPILLHSFKFLVPFLVTPFYISTT